MGEEKSLRAEPQEAPDPSFMDIWGLLAWAWAAPSLQLQNAQDSLMNRGSLHPLKQPSVCTLVLGPGSLSPSALAQSVVALRSADSKPVRGAGVTLPRAEQSI